MLIFAIDLGKVNSVVCRYETQTNQYDFLSLPTTPAMLTKALEDQPPGLVVWEACNLSGWVTDLCQQMEVQYLVANAAQEAWKWKNVKRKTDRDDALKLAKLAALEQLTPVFVPGPATRQLRSLIKYRLALVGRQTRSQNAIRALVAAQGLSMFAGAKAWTAEGLEELAILAKPLADCGRNELWRGQLHGQLQALCDNREQLKTVERRLDGLGQDNSQVALLRTIPGVGPRSAEMIAAWLDPVGRFRTGRQVSAYAGLVPRKFQSGSMDRNGRITGRGPRQLRAMLVEVAWVMLRYNDWALEVYQRLSAGQRTRRKQAVVAVARKLLVCCWAMLRDGRPWQGPPKRLITTA